LKRFATFLPLILLYFSSYSQNLLFWTGTNPDVIYKTNSNTLKTDSIVSILPISFSARKLSINPIEKSILYADTAQTMKMINFNGVTLKTIQSGNNNFSGTFDLDVDNNTIYYSGRAGQFQSYRIKDSVLSFLIPRIVAETIEIDEENRTLYNNLYDGINSYLVRFDLPLLSNQQIIYTAPANQKIEDFFPSPDNTSIYFVNRGLNAIQKIDYNGRNLETVHQGGLDRIRFIEGDFCADKIYFATTRFNNPGTNSKIKEIDFKGLNERTILDTNNLFISSLSAYIVPTKDPIKTDTTLCVRDSLIITYPLLNNSYLWQDGSVSNKKVIRQAGVYWVDVTRKNCVVRDSIVVSTFPFITSNFLGEDTTICQGDSIILNANLPGFDYLWSNGSTLPEITFKNAGTYYLQLSDGSCPLRDSVTISVKPTPSFSLGIDTALCRGDTLQPKQTQGNYLYLWNTGLNTDFIIPQQNGTFWLTASLDGCFATDSIDLVIKERPSINLRNDTVICFGDSLVLDGTATNATYRWNTADSSAFIKVGSAGNYKVTATSNGCSSEDSTSVTVLNNDLLFLGNDTTICGESSISFKSNISNSSYLWQNGSTSFEYSTSDSGLITLSIINQCGTTSDSLVLKTEDCNCSVLLPTVFTPNNDFINDEFTPRISCELETYSVEIYNRWGDKVFQSTQQKRAWDGTNDGNKLKDGVYFYVLKYNVLNAEIQTQKGSILLSR